MAFIKGVHINAPVEKVFKAASDFNNSVFIMDNVVGIEILTEGPVQKGTKIKEIREVRGRTIESILIFTEYVSNQKYSVKSEINGILIGYHYSFHPQDSGTVVNFEGFIRTKGFKNALLKPIITAIIKKEDGDHLDKLKDFIERKEGLNM
ncbi:SRPBCC family protein [Paenisporosarcina sp. TG-14]|uniref:SRPBCC family protein n=1 Tax=Paenisporosarcina sp. TG-14 TaxID=1231057 RepID=UPI000308211A|nr:SRPBCC family protein [Paenisporosarcina sp. TG-14]